MDTLDITVEEPEEIGVEVVESIPVTAQLVDETISFTVGSGESVLLTVQ